MILHVSFVSSVEVGGDLQGITSWSKAKHGDLIEVTEKGPYLHLKVKKSGETFRVPLSAINYIKDSADEPAKAEPGSKVKP